MTNEFKQEVYKKAEEFMGFVRTAYPNTSYFSLTFLTNEHLPEGERLNDSASLYVTVPADDTNGDITGDPDFVEMDDGEYVVSSHAIYKEER